MYSNNSLISSCFLYITSLLYFFYNQERLYESLLLVGVGITSIVHHSRLHTWIINDIWCYRAQLSIDIKIQICYPTGNPFSDIRFNELRQYNFHKIQLLTLKIIEDLITKAYSDENKKLGIFYVLSAFTLVNINAAESLPWLYEAVVL